MDELDKLKGVAGIMPTGAELNMLKKMSLSYLNNIKSQRRMTSNYFFLKSVFRVMTQPLSATF